MPRTQNDTPVPTQERPKVPFSPSDLVIPTAICAGVSVLLLLAFQPETRSTPSDTNLPIAMEPSGSLETQVRTAAVATELLTRDDISLETANACLTRLAALQNKHIATVCLESMQQLPANLSLQAQQRWAALLQKHGTANQNQCLTNDQSKYGPAAKKIGRAVALTNSPDHVSAFFAQAALNTQHMIELIQAIPIIADPEISLPCFHEIQKWIITPACQHPAAVDNQLLLATIKCVAEMKIDQSKKVSTFCELVEAKNNRADCFRNLQQLGVNSIPDHLKGHVAAALIDHLAIDAGNPHSVCCPTVWQFAESMRNVFSGQKRVRFQSRLLEIRRKTLPRLANTSP
ncbi:MAG: hypothetical protein ABJZ55_11445 [Fuerstiella sp.]